MECLQEVCLVIFRFVFNYFYFSSFLLVCYFEMR